MGKNFISRKFENRKNFSGGGGSTLRAVGSGLISFLALLIIFSVILSLIVMYMPVSETTVHVLYISILLVASLIGGFKAGRKCSHKGLVHGFAVGIIICMAALIFTGCTAEIAAYDAVIKSLVVMIATSIGGIIGIK